MIWSDVRHHNATFLISILYFLDHHGHRTAQWESVTWCRQHHDHYDHYHDDYDHYHDDYDHHYHDDAHHNFIDHHGCPAAWSECVTSLVSATVGKYLLPLAGLPWAPVIVIDIRPILASIYSHQYCPLSLAEIGRQFVTICDKISIIFIIISNSGQIFTLCLTFLGSLSLILAPSLHLSSSSL